MQKQSFNHEEINFLYKEYGKNLSKASSEYFLKIIGELNDLVKDLRLSLEKYMAQENVADDNYLHLSNFRKDVLKAMSGSIAFLSNYQLEKLTESYNGPLRKAAQTQSLFITKKEVFEAYSLKSNGNLILFFKKWGANINLYSKKRQRKLLNLFRALLKKDLLDVRSYRKRKIPFRSMIGFYLGPEYHKELSIILGDLLKTKGGLLSDIWQVDDLFTVNPQINTKREEKNDEIETVDSAGFINKIEETEEKIAALKASVLKQIDEALYQVFLRFDNDLAIVDTPDLSSKKFRKAQLIQNENKSALSIETSISRWKNTHLALFDDWSLDVDIMLLYFNVLHEHQLLNKQISNYINDNLGFGFEQFRDFIKDSNKRVDQAKTAAELRKILNLERHKNSAEFIDKMLSKTINRLSVNINDHLNSYKQKTLAFVDLLPDKRAFIKGKKYLKESRENELSWLSPKDLLNFEALPGFVHSIEDVESFVSAYLEKTRVKLIALGTVSDFSLESAQMMLDEKKGAVKGAQKVVSDGYQRALVHLKEAEDLLEKIKTEPLNKLQVAIDGFNANIQKLTLSENILELQMKIVKIRAINRSKRMRKDAWEWVVHFVPKSRQFFTEQFKVSNTAIINVKKKLGIKTEKPHISHELSDFLRKTEQSLKKLPFVYQRLYQLTPTDEERFFVGRETELEKLTSAFETWENDRFITTALIGEKGSGITSLIQFFLKTIDRELPVIHLELSSKIYLPQDYLQFFAKAFEQESFSSNQEIIEFVNQKKTKSIIIIENLQHLYLKVVNGFVCQKMLFDLMTNTWDQLFWLGAYTTYSWEYLDKTIQVSSVFTKEIHLNKFTDETLADVIFKRNYLSGYQIEFLSSESNKNNKPSAKLDEKTKQTNLQKSFFKELNQMSNGNVSLAQLYWLRSTHGIEEGIIKIQSLRDFDVSFDKDLPSSYMFALHAILVHDGLIISDYSKVFNLPEYICRNDLSPMLEKGLLIKPKDKYNINPIIFRQVVDLLRSQNFIN